MSVKVNVARLSSRGQIVIPKELREELGLKKDDLLLITTIEDTLVMKKLDRTKLLEEFESIRKAVKEKLSSEEVERLVHESRSKGESGY